MYTRTILASTLVLALATPGLVWAAGSGTITFKVTCETNKIEKDEGTTVRITAKKGTKELDETHLFPKGSTTDTAVGHFADKLTEAGFVEGTDFAKADNTLVFKNVDTLDGGTGKVSQYKVTFAKTGDVTIADAAPGAKVELVRNSDDAGEVLLAAFGITRDGRGTITATPSNVRLLHVAEGASADEVIAGMHDLLLADGWGVWLESGNVMMVESMPDGTPITSLTLTPYTSAQIFPGAAGPEGEGEAGEETDHWRVHPAGASADDFTF